MKRANLQPVILRPRAGNVSATTDGSGLVTVAHGGPSTPVAVQLSGRNASWDPVLAALTGTTITVRMQRRSTEETAPGGTAAAFDWTCFF